MLKLVLRGEKTLKLSPRFDPWLSLKSHNFAMRPSITARCDWDEFRGAHHVNHTGLGIFTMYVNFHVLQRKVQKDSNRHFFGHAALSINPCKTCRTEVRRVDKTWDDLISEASQHRSEQIIPFCPNVHVQPRAGGNS
jgi:hypothetical protein